MRVRDLMQAEVATVQAGDTLDLVDDIMELGRIRHLPVVHDGRLVGILSQRDLLRATVSSLLQFDRRAQQDWLAGITVDAVMTRGVVVAAPDEPVRAAVGRMLERRIGCLPVVAADGELVGLLGESDCLRHLAHVLDIVEEKGALPELARAS